MMLCLELVVSLHLYRYPISDQNVKKNKNSKKEKKKQKKKKSSICYLEFVPTMVTNFVMFLLFNTRTKYEFGGYNFRKMY